MLTPVVLSAVLIVVLAAAFVGGAFKSSGNLDKHALERVVLATGWRVTRSPDGSRDKTRLSPADDEWEIVLRTSERTGSRGTGGAAAVFATGGSGTAWHARGPAIRGLVVVAPGRPLPEGAVNDLLAGPAVALFAGALPRVLRELTGGDVPTPSRLVSFRTGDVMFDADHCLVSDDPELARRVVSAEVAAALAPIAGLRPSLVLSSAGAQLAIEGAPRVEAAILLALVEAGKRVQAGLAAGS